MNLSSDEIIEILGLKPLPEEGGFYLRTYESQCTIQLERGLRNIGDHIYYLITKDQFSHLHLLQCDEMWHFYAGDPIEMILFDSESFDLIEIGNTNLRNHRPQQLVKANKWQGAKLKEGGSWALIGTNAFPAYSQNDFTLGKQEMFNHLPSDRLEIVQRYI